MEYIKANVFKISKELIQEIDEVLNDSIVWEIYKFTNHEDQIESLKGTLNKSRELLKKQMDEWNKQEFPLQILVCSNCEKEICSIQCNIFNALTRNIRSMLNNFKEMKNIYLS